MGHGCRTSGIAADVTPFDPHHSAASFGNCHPSCHCAATGSGREYVSVSPSSNVAQQCQSTSSLNATARPLRICFVSADYPTTSPRGVGGIGAHTYSLAHAVADLGHQVVVVTQSEGNSECHADGPVDVHPLPRGSARMWKLGHWLPVYMLRRSFAVWHKLKRMHAQNPFDIVSFPDGYGEAFR